MNALKGFVETAHGVDQNVKDQVLSGGDVDFVGFGGLTEKLGEMLGALQKRQGMRKKELALGRERLLAADAAALLIERHA